MPSSDGNSSSLKTITVLLMSKTGSGKSSLANALLDTGSFDVGLGMVSQTETCSSQTQVAHGRLLTVIDTPGTMDVTDPNMPMEELPKALNANPGGIDAFLLVIRLDIRFTQEEYKAIEDSVSVFGPESCKRAIVVFSRGDAFKNDLKLFEKKLAEFRKKILGLDALLTKFGNRYVMMDNRAEDADLKFKQQQVAALLELVDKVAELNPMKYSKSDLDAQAKKKQEEEERRRQEKRKRDKTNMELMSMKAKLEAMEWAQRQQQQQLQFSQGSNQGPTITDLLVGVGQSAGAVLASPAVGAIKLIEHFTN